ncbi:nrps [Metarhizium rileyi]|uniref:Nrps n=1 Tax=Metarhizium rileyi (strain RCEF 4871) TaxID=1649241 RepID=A0A5C6G678_METRR|nr:nrps [Metarhizium rileyi]
MAVESLPRLDECHSSAVDNIRQVWAFNKKPPPVADKCIHSIIAARNASQPGKTVVRAWDGSLTFRQLDELSARLASYLAALGVGPEVIVPVCFEKSMWVVVATLGVLKAGGAFTLVDPGLPDERVRSICLRVRASTVVTSPRCRTLLSSFAENAVVLDSQQLVAEMPSCTFPICQPSPTDAAYVIFTSGSTGQPKGCLVDHRAFCSAALSHGTMLNINQETRSLQFSSYAFGVCLVDIFTTLIHGGCVCIPSEEDRSIARLPAAIRKLNANWVTFTPSTLAQIRPEDVPSLQTIVVGGEPPQISQIKQWSSRVHLRQGYGCAEACVASSALQLSEGSAPGDIGYVTTGRFWIVDETDSNRLVPVGVPGELIFEGAAMGREYIDEPEQTSRAFIEMPPWRASFGPCEAASRFYKTGDVAVFNPDGSVRLLGRKDTQVKLNGRRIEIGEIEHQARLSTPAVKEVAVEFTMLNHSDKRRPGLIGFLVLEEDEAGPLNMNMDMNTTHRRQASGSNRALAAIQSVQAKLQRVLPYYMVPSVLVILPSLPKTPTGKVYRNQLREMGSAFSPQDLAKLCSLARGDIQKPRTEQERRLRDLWAAVLRVEPDSIGVDDNFFHLGGDSEAAIRLVGAARSDGFTISAADVFRKPLLSALAQIQPAQKCLGTEEITPFSLLRDSRPDTELRTELSGLFSGDQLLIEDAYPCTSLQEGLLSLSAKGVGDYVEQIILDMSDEVDVVAFKAAWEDVVRATAILRTRIMHHPQHGLVQVVCHEGIYWTQSNSLEDYLGRDKMTPMELGGRMSRYALIVEDKMVPRRFVWTLHHAIYDGWSLPRIIDSVAEAYSSNGTGKRPAFNTFIRHISNGTGEDGEAYWRSYLADASFSPFPTVSKSVREPAVDSYLERRHRLSSSRTMDVTLSTLIRGALAILISRYTASRDVIFGAVLSGRNAPVAGIEDIIGPTIATVPVRISLGTDQSVQQYLQMVQRQAAEMMPFEQMGLKRIAKLGRNGQSACDFQTLLAVQPESSINTGGALGQWTLSSVRPTVTTYALGLECFIEREREEVTIKAFFDKTIVDVWQAENMLRQLDAVLTQLENASPEKMVSEIDALTAEDEKAVWTWNQKVPSATNRLLHDLVGDRVLMAPDAPAVCGPEGRLTFGELDELSTRLALQLVRLGVRRERLVPLCFEKSIWAVVAMIGVLKAGGAFVPLDPEQSSEHRRLVLEKTRALLVVTSSSYRNIPLPQGCRALVVTKDSLARVGGDDGNLLPSRVEPDSAAYVIFTSGSTGQPKGVVVEHGAISSNCLGHGSVFGFSPASVVLQFASYTFDACLFEIIMTLVHGGCVCVPSEEQRLGDLVGAINAMSVNTALLTPSVARMISPESVPTLHTLIMGGEAVTEADFDRWDSVPRRFNGYGPTEATVIAVVDCYERHAVGEDRIGKAVGCATWVVDPLDQNRLAPLGTVGELLIEGPSLAREYLADLEATAAAFIHDPPWLVRGCQGQGSLGRRGRLYKTGDLARYNRDGSLSFIGRKDSRLKIRGQWFDVAKMESQVRKYLPPGTHAVAEMIEPAGAENKKLLAVFIENLTPGIDVNGGKGAGIMTGMIPVGNGIELARLQPDLELALSRDASMNTIPMVYFRVARFPVMSSGKTNRRHLREMGSALSTQQLTELQTAAGKGNRQPSTEMESLLQGVWAQVLNIKADSIGIDDNFFHLGGDSITAMQVSAAARASLVDISTTDILRKRTVAMLAATAGSISEGPGSDFHGGNEKDDGVVFGLSPIQQLYVHHETNTNNIRCFDQNFFLELRIPLQYARIKKAMETVVTRHPMLRTRFRKTKAGRWEQRVVDDVSSSLRIGESNAGNEGLAIRRCRETIDIEKGPLVAAEVFNDTDTDDMRIFITVHHFAIDLVSWRILLQELECLLGYDSDHALSPPSLGFHSWCALQTQYSANNLQDVQDAASAPDVSIQPPLLSYWGVEEHENTQGNTVTKGFRLDKSTSVAILGRCNKAFATRPVELIMSALIHSFHVIFTDRPPPTMFSEGHGREPWDDGLDVSGTMGWFTTIWPVRVPSVAHRGLLDTVRQVKDAVRGLSKNGWAYFTSRFADEEKARANASDFPVEIMLNFAGSFQQLERDGSIFDPLPLPGGCHPPGFSELTRFALFDVVATTNKGCLSIDFVYNVKSLHQDRIMAWVGQYHTVLQELVGLLGDRPTEWTLAEFPMAFKSYDAIAGFQSGLLPQLGIPHAGDVEDIYPCSPIQEKIWRDQEQDAYKSRLFFDIEITAGSDGGGINLAGVEQAWRAVAQRHSLLRGVLVDGVPGSDRPMNVILRDPMPSVSYIQAGDVAVEVELGDRQNQRAPIPYKRNGLQYHLTLRQNDENHITLHLEMNHAIVDGYSTFKVLLDDFCLAHGGRLSTTGPPYSRFIQHIEEQSREANHAYWTQYLSNAAWAMVLKTYTGCPAPCFGMFTSGRDIPVKDVDKMFGPLLCVVPRRIRLDGHCSVVDTLKGIHEDYFGSLPYQTYPVADMCKALDIRPPGLLFNTNLSYQRGRLDDVRRTESGRSYRFGKMRQYGGESRQGDVLIQARDHGTAFTIMLLLKPGFISDSEATALAGSFSAAIRCIVCNPGKPTCEVAIEL